MRILVIEPYFTGSHRYFHEHLCNSLRELGHEVLEITMKGRHWRWRIQGAHFSLACQVNNLIQDQNIDLIWSNSLIDICSLKGLLSKQIPFVAFFHEHQMSYPFDENYHEAQSILKNHVFPGIHASQYFSSALTLFSSEFNRNSFFTGIERFFKSRPEKLELNELIKPVGICPIPLVGDFKNLPEFSKRPRRILWNHRWDFDKNPNGFSKLIMGMKKLKADFSVELLGQFKENVFDHLKACPEVNIDCFGGPKLRSEYLKRLSHCRVLPVTSHHDFFGISVREAILSGVIPLLPRRMAYPECLPEELHNTLLYDNEVELLQKCQNLLNNGLKEEQYRLLLNFHRGNDLKQFQVKLKEFLEILNS